MLKIEVSGPPSSGKSQIIYAIGKALRQLGIEKHKIHSIEKISMGSNAGSERIPDGCEVLIIHHQNRG